MLSPRDRVLLFQSLRPPHGYRLDRAIGTSFSLDLLALLTAPLAFAFYDWEDSEGQATRDPVALMHALRSNAKRVHLFCQAGEIHVPSPGQPLFAYLESSVIEARAPTPGASFHPKIWVLRYKNRDEPARYRVLVSSRNLTFDRSWDTLLVLDGELRKRQVAYKRNHPLGDFVAALADLAVDPLPEETRSAIETIGKELRMVDFECPPGFDELYFHPIGIANWEEHWPLRDGGRRCLVVSPFLSSKLLREIAEECADAHGADRISIDLVSRAESLAELAPDVIERLTRMWTLSADADAEEGDEEPESGQSEPHGKNDTLSGLHAKLFVLQRKLRAHVFTGSANATNAAFERNVEFLVELVGGLQNVGIPALLGNPEDPDQATGTGKLRDLLDSWQPGQEEPDPEAELREKLRSWLDKARRDIAAARLALDAESCDEGQSYKLTLRGSLPALPESTKLRCWPTSRTRQHAVVPAASGDLAIFTKFAPIELTAFLAFELTASAKGIEEISRFARRLPLEGVPSDREERLLRNILKDKETVLRLLWILLSSDDLAAEDLGLGAGSGHFTMRPGLGGMPVLEAMVRTLARDPASLTAVQKLIEDLSRSEEGRALLPDGLDAIWEPIRVASEELAQ